MADTNVKPLETFHIPVIAAQLVGLCEYMFNTVLKDQYDHIKTLLRGYDATGDDSGERWNAEVVRPLQLIRGDLIEKFAQLPDDITDDMECAANNLSAMVLLAQVAVDALDVAVDKKTHTFDFQDVDTYISSSILKCMLDAVRQNTEIRFEGVHVMPVVSRTDDGRKCTGIQVLEAPFQIRWGNLNTLGDYKGDSTEPDAGVYTSLLDANNFGDYIEHFASGEGIIVREHTDAKSKRKPNDGASLN